MSTNTLTPDEEAYVDREIAEPEEKQRRDLERLQQYLKNQQQHLEREQKDVERLQKDAERQYREMIGAMNSGAPINYGTDKELREELDNLGGTRKKCKRKKHKKKH